MSISELENGQKNVVVEKAKITDVSGIREFQKFGKPGRVAQAEITDDTGKIALTLWNEQIDHFKEGDEVRIEGARVQEWQGRLQLSTGFHGTITKL